MSNAILRKMSSTLSERAAEIDIRGDAKKAAKEAILSLYDNASRYPSGSSENAPVTRLRIRDSLSTVHTYNPPSRYLIAKVLIGGNREPSPEEVRAAEEFTYDEGFQTVLRYAFAYQVIHSVHLRDLARMNGIEEIPGITPAIVEEVVDEFLQEIEDLATT